MKTESAHLKARLMIALLLVLFACPAVFAQEVADTIKIRTRVVFLDALVKDKRTGTPISDLKPENFTLFDDGKPRMISYFNNEGQARKPLALILVLDLDQDGAGRFLKRDEVRASIIDELAKLPPGDEVAVLAINTNNIDDKSAAIRNFKALWLTGFTRDRGQIEKALGRIPALVAEPPKEVKNDPAKNDPNNPNREGSLSIGASSDGNAAQSADAKSKENDVLETETIKGKNGAVITRTIKKDGSVTIQRVSSSGKVNIVLDNIYDIAGATRDAIHFAADKRPNSQTAIVWMSDGIAPIFKEDVGATQQILIKENAIFNSLNVDMKTLYKFLLPLGQPLIGWTGISLAGSARRLAQESGGESVHVSRVKDYGAGLARVIGNLNARYSLGFALGEDERDDGRMHELTLRVKATDAKGKERRLDVSSRRGYYMPKSETAEAITK
ncbi:MAG TPA: VWA domain-containing protein [Pyrinomonadaceae bacterium]|jgi:VWFA-related protein|nr:VWA domain-containing protein [Pyrinomonadaceae bacterium]